MRLRNILGLALGMAAMVGCKEVTATHRVDTVTVAPVNTGGWQVTLQSSGNFWVDAVYAVKTDAFHRPSIGDFRYANSAVVNLRGNKDTVWVGFSIYSWLDRDDFVGDSVTWSFTSSMTPSNPGGINLGSFSSLYGYDVESSTGAYTYVTGSHPVNMIGHDFEYTKRVSMRNVSEVSGVTVVYRPMVCGEHASRQLLSNGVTETQSDSLKQYRYRMDAPSMTMVCNPTAPTALRSLAAVGEEPSRLIDHFRSKVAAIKLAR
jgi:hypothetical protein